MKKTTKPAAKAKTTAKKVVAKAPAKKTVAAAPVKKKKAAPAPAPVKKAKPAKVVVSNSGTFSAYFTSTTMLGEKSETSVMEVTGGIIVNAKKPRSKTKITKFYKPGEYLSYFAGTVEDGAYAVVKSREPILEVAIADITTDAVWDAVTLTWTVTDTEGYVYVAFGGVEVDVEIVGDDGGAATGETSSKPKKVAKAVVEDDEDEELEDEESEDEDEEESEEEEEEEESEDEDEEEDSEDEEGEEEEEESEDDGWDDE